MQAAWRVRVVLSLLLVVVACTAGVARASQGPNLGRCRSVGASFGGTPEQLAGQVVLFRNENVSGLELWLACWIPTGQHQLIARFPYPSRIDYIIGGVAVSGPWLVWLVDEGPDKNWNTLQGWTSNVYAINVRNARKGPSVSRAMSDELLNTPTDGPPPSGDTGFGARLSDTVVAPNGWYAWVSQYPRSDALYVPDGEGGDIRVDASAPGNGTGISSLKLHGSTITWVIDGVRKQLQLGPGTPAALTPAGVSGSTGASSN
jgi:hypothetical protein